MFILVFLKVWHRNASLESLYLLKHSNYIFRFTDFFSLSILTKCVPQNLLDINQVTHCTVKNDSILVTRCNRRYPPVPAYPNHPASPPRIAGPPPPPGSLVWCRTAVWVSPVHPTWSPALVLWVQLYSSPIRCHCPRKISQTGLDHFYKTQGSIAWKPLKPSLYYIKNGIIT